MPPHRMARCITRPCLAGNQAHPSCSRHSWRVNQRSLGLPPRPYKTPFPGHPLQEALQVTVILDRRVGLEAPSHPLRTGHQPRAMVDRRSSKDWSMRVSHRPTITRTLHRHITSNNSSSSGMLPSHKQHLWVLQLWHPILELQWPRR